MLDHVIHSRGGSKRNVSAMPMNRGIIQSCCLFALSRSGNLWYIGLFCDVFSIVANIGKDDCEICFIIIIIFIRTRSTQNEQIIQK